MLLPGFEAQFFFLQLNSSDFLLNCQYDLVNIQRLMPICCQNCIKFNLQIVSVNYSLVFFISPSLLTNIWIQMIVPTLSTLFTDSARKMFGYEAPILGSMIFDQTQYQFILLFGLFKEIDTQGPLTREGLSTFCHRCRHCTSVLSSKKEAIFFQFFAPYYQTSCFSFQSYCGVHQCFCTAAVE